LVVQTLQVLDVHCREYIYPGREQNLHILPAFRTFRSGDIRMRKFIHRADLRTSRQNGGCVHLLENRSAIVDPLPGYDLKSFGFSDGFLPAMRLEITDHNIDAGPLQFVGLFQHLIGLAHSRGVAHEDLQLSAPSFGHSYWGKMRTSMP